jgi:hypothetical protein
MRKIDELGNDFDSKTVQWKKPGRVTIFILLGL